MFGETHFFLNFDATIVNEIHVWMVNQVYFSSSQHILMCNCVG